MEKKIIKKENAIKGYKAFHFDKKNKKLFCRDFEFQHDKIFCHVGEVKICASGFHFCKKLADVSRYYNHAQINYGSVIICEVEGWGRVSTGDNSCTKLAVEFLKVKKALTRDEILAICKLPKRVKIKYKVSVIHDVFGKEKIYASPTGNVQTGIRNLYYFPLKMNSSLLKKSQKNNIYESWANVEIREGEHFLNKMRTGMNSIRRSLPVDITLTGRPKLIKKSK